jgi:hypothetical protein
MMQGHFQGARFEMKTNAHTLQEQEMDREFQPEGFKTELKEGRLEKQKGLNCQAKNP